MFKVDSIYLTDDQFQAVLKPLNVELSDEEQQELLDRAVGDLEGELVLRFVVPLRSGAAGDYASAQAYSRNIVLTALKSRIKSLVGIDKNRNVVVEQGQRYIDLHKIEFDGRIKMLLDPHRKFDFQLQPQAQDAIDPIQSIGVARADNRLHLDIDGDAI
ncbi:MAG: hypothetical protein ACXWPM_00015 [Bdellovibrionota bacterium]